MRYWRPVFDSQQEQVFFSSPRSDRLWDWCSHLSSQYQCLFPLSKSSRSVGLATCI
jgi:hypothetical protein